MLQLAKRNYNRILLSVSQRERITVVLVSPRNPLNIGAVARAMANFGFTHLTVVDPYAPHWREARSAVGAPDLLTNAQETQHLAEAVKDCTLVLGTGSLTYRKPEQPVVRLDKLAQSMTREISEEGRIAFVFGSEKHGLTREELSYCQLLVEIPTDRKQPSMNLGQAVAVCLYELAIRCGPFAPEADANLPVANTENISAEQNASTSENLDILAGLVEEVMVAANYSPNSMQEANRHDLRLMLRRLHLNAKDARRILGLFRRILRRLQRATP